MTIPGSGSGNSRPGITIPGSGSGNHPGVTIPGTGGNSHFNRPSQGDLNNFLHLPGQPGGGSGNFKPGGGKPGTGGPGNGGPGNIGDRFPNRPGGGDSGNGNHSVNRPNIGSGNTFNKNNNININAGNKVGNKFDRDVNINNVRNKWSHVNNGQYPFNKGWWNGNRYPNNPNWRWHTGWNRYPNYWCWRPATWGSFGTWFLWGAWAQPYYYNYGSTVVYRDNYVYVNNQQMASAQQYYQQADNIADSIPQNVNPDNVDWMPLGVFAVTDDTGTDSSIAIQLAVSKEGIIAGTIYNDITGSERPLQGMVDQKTQRAAWKFADGKNQDIVMETGIYDLTKDEATALIHYGADQTQTLVLVRLPQPEDNQNAPSS
ncbi:hypothetical protein GC197_04175 [bacterium]|nr:hypothetical protein [bacterium]